MTVTEWERKYSLARFDRAIAEEREQINTRLARIAELEEGRRLEEKRIDSEETTK